MLFATASATLLVVAATSYVSSRATLQMIEGHLRQGILDKGSGLVVTQALALRDLVADNAFGDVARLVERTVSEDRQVMYGLFLDESSKPWGFVVRGRGGAVDTASSDPDGWRRLGIDVKAMRLTGVQTRTRPLDDGAQLFEFATPVVDDHGGFLGSLRYALSDQPLREALEEARSASRRALVLTVGMLLLLGAGTTVLGVQLSRRAGTRIARPVVDLTEAARALAGGQRDIRVGINSGDELELLGNAFNDMTAQLRDSYERLEEMNRNLEGTVAERTRALGARNHDMRRVLDNVKQGFVTVSRTGELAQERSAIVDKWFGPLTAGTPFARYVAAADPAFASSFAAAYDQLIDDFLPRDLCLDQMPRRLTQAGRELRCNYVPLTEGDQIQGLLVVIEDITTELEQQRGEADRKEMFALFEALTRDRLGLLGFFDEGNDIMRGLPTADNETQKRQLHTLKGNAAMLGFDVLATLCHGLENDMAESGAGVLTPSQVDSLRQRWSALTAALNRFLGDHGRDTIELSARTIDRLARDVQAGASTFQVLQRLAAWKLEPADRPLGRLAAFARALAKRLGKGELEVEVESQGVRLDPDEWAGLWSQLGHVVRNAVDHGIETPAARRDARKAAGARLRLGASVLGSRLVVRVEDDGAGIDWEAVRTSAQRRGLPHATRAELVDALFKSGLTTRSSASRTSGRGVGLASIQSFVEERRGRVTVESRTGEGTTFEFSFPLGEEGYLVTSDSGETGRLRA